MFKSQVSSVDAYSNLSDRTPTNKSWAATPGNPPPQSPPLEEATTRAAPLSSKKKHSSHRLLTSSPLTPPTPAPLPNWDWSKLARMRILKVFVFREALSAGSQVAAKLPPTARVPQPGQKGFNSRMPSCHQQIHLQPATTTAAAVCLTAPSCPAWGQDTRVALLHLLLPAPRQYLSSNKVGRRRPGDTRAGPAVIP